MGFKLSRLAQAIMAAVLCSTAAIAADKADDFYIEIKKPDSSVQQSVKPAGERLAQPYIPERIDKSLITADSKIYGPVKTTDTSWSIANKIRILYPGQGLSTRKVMQALYRKNPHAFAEGRLDYLLAGSRLAIPSLNEIKTATSRAPAKQTVPAQVATATSSASTTATTATAPAVSASAPTTDAAVTAPAVSASVPTTDTVATALAVSVSGAAAVASTESSLIDSKVSELVNGAEPKPIVTLPASSAGVATQSQAVNEDLVAYQSENKELKEQLQRLNAEIGSLQATVNEQTQLKEELASLQAKLKEQEQAAKVVQEKKPESVSQSSGTKESVDILALPLNIQLLISLPLLAFLVVLSLWLRSRTKQEVVAHERPAAEGSHISSG